MRMAGDRIKAKYYHFCVCLALVFRMQREIWISSSGRSRIGHARLMALLSNQANSRETGKAIERREMIIEMKNISKVHRTMLFFVALSQFGQRRLNLVPSIFSDRLVLSLSLACSARWQMDTPFALSRVCASIPLEHCWFAKCVDFFRGRDAMCARATTR